MLMQVSHAQAACTPTTSVATPLNNTTVTCTGTTNNQNGTNGYGGGFENGLNITVQSGATVTGSPSFPGDGFNVQDNNIITNSGNISGGKESWLATA